MLGEPMAGEDFQYPIASFATPAFAVNHVDAAQSALCGIVQKFRQQFSGRIAVETVQVEFILYAPIAVAQLAQCQAIQAGAQEFRDGVIAGAVIGQGVADFSGGSADRH